MDVLAGVDVDAVAVGELAADVEVAGGDVGAEVGVDAPDIGALARRGGVVVEEEAGEVDVVALDGFDDGGGAGTAEGAEGGIGYDAAGADDGDVVDLAGGEEAAVAVDDFALEADLEDCLLYTSRCV